MRDPPTDTNNYTGPLFKLIKLFKKYSIGGKKIAWGAGETTNPKRYVEEINGMAATMRTIKGNHFNSI